MTAKLKRIRVPKGPTLPRKCSARPPLDGPINPMLFCQFPPKHKGPHSWDPKAKR